MAELTGKTCLITGANTGIGRATAEALAKQGATVVMLCRSRERGEQARQEIVAASGNKNVELLVADLASMRQVRAAAADFLRTHDRLHVLVNNAAVFLPKREETEDGLEKTFATNYLSHFLLTHLLLDVLKKSAPSRIINVASKTMGKINFDDLQLKSSYSTMNAVQPTKMGLVMFTLDLAERLKGTGVTVNALHPGLVKTPLLDEIPWLMRKFFHLFSSSPEKGAQTPIYLATSPEVADVSGKFFADKKVAPFSSGTTDPAARAKLWEISAKLTGLSASA